MKLAAELKERTEKFYEHVKVNNPFYRSLFAGDIQTQTVAYFLESARYLVWHTPKHLALALREAEKRGAVELAAFFKQKIAEEVGHDKWAEADLLELAALDPNLKKPQEVAPAILEIIARNERLIARDPYLYLVHIFFAEYFTVCDGPDFMAALATLGITPPMVSVVSNHVELDVGHVAEWEEVIDDLVDVQAYRDNFLDVLSESFTIYEKFCANLESVGHAN